MADRSTERELTNFPLLLSVFERYMLLDDRPSHPMASFLEVDLQGDLSQAELQSALSAALVRHPLLNSQVQRDTDGKLRWHIRPESIQIQTLNVDEHPPKSLEFDLALEPGLRIWTRKTTRGLDLILLVHHATSDALGMLTFIMEWLALATGEVANLPPESMAELCRREDLTGVQATFPLRMRVRNICRYLFGRSPAPLALPETSQPVRAAEPESFYHVVRLTQSEFCRLKERAHQAHVSLNDWLTAALFQSLARWNDLSTNHASENLRSDQQPSGARPARVLIPVNRRGATQRFLSGCNCIGYKMLTRPQNEIGSFPRLLESIRDEMAPIRKNPAGVHNFVKMLRLFARLGLLHRTVRQYDCFATVILSNLGDVSQYFQPLLPLHNGGPKNGKLTAGSVSIQAIRCAPPRRPNTHLTVVAMTYGGELQLISSRISSGLTDAHTLNFLQLFRETIVHSCEGGHA